MKKYYFIMLFTIFALLNIALLAQEDDPSKTSDKKNVIIKYRENEKFDLDDLSVEGDNASPGDLSVSPRFKNAFENKLPHRHNFNPEIRNGVEAIR